MASEKIAYELKIRCKYCDRFLNVKAIESSHITVRCPDRKCKMDNEIKISMLSDHINEDHQDCGIGCKHDHSELKVMRQQ